MINEDEVLNSGFLDPSSSKFMMDTSLRTPTFTTPLYSSQFETEEEDPWGSIAAFDPVDDIRQHLTTTNMSSNAVDEEILEDGLTSASVLIGIDLPEIYDRAYIRTHPNGDKVALESFNKILEIANLSPRTNDQIRSLIVPSNAMYVTRNEFNTGIALIACAQKNMGKI
ncbi:hypothetical protein BJ944DRAFT_244977 [Cunninghamella echinulata]|nr:hypothetical protein BJ944DRAFT_244977 [Cunninghamella echinulata]